jgi:hypothetical protein
MRQRLAPKAMRTAISLVRVVAPAKSRLAMLTQALKKSEANGAEEHEQRGRHVPNDHLLERLNARLPAAFPRKLPR